ncbi:unnamed protein product [Ranitomeya imitator]|uniref:SAM domain-containing protein n=1 Tax=Ranitomeya imitator TaxID=111125 RepID=A0ABN9LML2_9NEOB|nr:unnamed protein product [Ranitomeya imitator]
MLSLLEEEEELRMPYANFFLRLWDRLNCRTMAAPCGPCILHINPVRRDGHVTSPAMPTGPCICCEVHLSTDWLAQGMDNAVFDMLEEGWDGFSRKEMSTGDSIATGSVPQDWRIANVVPIFKKGSKSEPGNYRPESADDDGLEDDTGSEGTSSEVRDDHTDTSSVEVPSVRPRRAVTLRNSIASDRPPLVERSRRVRKTHSLSYAEKVDTISGKDEMKQEEEECLVLESNPLEWTVMDVVKFIKSTDCAPLSKIFQEQDIDGQAFLLLTLPTVQDCMELKLGPAIKLCHQIERVKVAFYAQYAN